MTDARKKPPEATTRSGPPKAAYGAEGTEAKSQTGQKPQMPKGAGAGRTKIQKEFK